MEEEKACKDNEKKNRTHLIMYITGRITTPKRLFRLLKAVYVFPPARKIRIGRVIDRVHTQNIKHHGVVDTGPPATHVAMRS